MKFLSNLLFLCFFLLSCVHAAEHNSLITSNAAKQQLDTLWDDMMKKIAGFKKLKKSNTFRWLFDIFSVKEYVTENPIILTQCLDLLIYELLADVFAMKGIVQFTALTDLDQIDFNPPMDYLIKMSVRVNLLRNQASKLPEISKKWVTSLCDVQKSAVSELIEKLNAGLPIRLQGSQELADALNTLCDFRTFFNTHTADGVALEVELLSALADAPSLFKLVRKGLAGLKGHPLEFPETSLVPAFLVFHQDARPHFSLNSLYLLLLHARKALSPFFLGYEDPKHQFDAIRMLSVIPDVFPTLEDKLARIRTVLMDAREVSVKGQPFKVQQWKHSKTVLASIIYSLHLLDNEPSKINLISAISDNCLISIGGILSADSAVPLESELVKAIASILSQTLSSRNMKARVLLLKKIDEFMPTYAEFSVDAKYWLHKLFELLAICHCAIDEYVKPLLEPLFIDKSYSKVFRNLHERMGSQYGSLKNLKGHKLITTGDLFCKNELIRLGVHQKTVSIDIKPKVHGNNISPSEFNPSPASTSPVSMSPASMSPASISPQSSISPHDDIDTIVAHIEGTKKPARKPKPKKVKAPIMFIDDTADWEESEEDEIDSENTETTTSGNSSSVEREEDILQVQDVEEEAEEREEEEQNSSPVHIMSLVDSEDIDLLEKIDARDLVYSYLAIGNSVFYSFISPLIFRLQSHQIFLYPVFLQSLQRFEAEVQILWMSQRAMLKPIFDDLGIDGMSFFGNCLKFYGKRLKVAHQHPPMNLETRRSFAKMHLATLNASVHSFYEKGSDTVQEHQYNFNWNSVNTFTVCPFLTENRSGLPTADDINYELSILGLSGLFKTAAEARLSGGRTAAKLRTIRRPIAHQRPSNSLLSAIIKMIFSDSHHYNFLRKLLK